MRTKHSNTDTHTHTHTHLTLKNSEDTCTEIQVLSQQGPTRNVRQLLRVRKAVPWSEGSTKEEHWGNARQSTRQDPQQFSDFSEHTWGPLPLLENCTSLACRQKASISPGARRGRSHWALENTLEALCLNLLFPFYSISDLSSPPDSFSSHRLPFFSKLASHTGWWSTTCQTAAPLILRGFAESASRKDWLWRKGREHRTELPRQPSPLTQRTPSAKARYSPAYFWTKSTCDAAEEELSAL